MSRLLCLGLLLIGGGWLAGLAGCGYTLAGTSSASGQRPRIAVLPFTNQTYEPEIETHLTAALRHALIRNHTVALTSAAAAAQHLSGIVRSFQLSPVAFDANDNALQYRIEAAILIRLVETSSRRTIFEQEISSWAEYLTSSSRDVREETVAKEAAVLLLAQRFADKCAALLMVSFW